MQRERSFDIWIDFESLAAGQNWQESIHGALEKYSDRGYVVAFWSEAAASSKNMAEELRFAAQQIGDFNDRALFALLEDARLPDFWMRYQEPGVQVYGDRERSETQRLDDLVVRLYWLVYRKTGQRHLNK
jgi:TIR domain